MKKILQTLLMGIPLAAVAMFGGGLNYFTQRTASAGYGGMAGYGGLPNITYKTIFSSQLASAGGGSSMGTAYFNARDPETAIDYAVNIGSSGVIRADLHCATTGQVGPAIVPLFNSSSSPSSVSGELVSGTLDVSRILPIAMSCSPNINTVPHLVQAMREGKIYLNVDTTDGSFRGWLGSGQFTPSPTPAVSPLPSITGGTGMTM
jgi:hypothetical protein